MIPQLTTVVYGIDSGLTSVITLRDSLSENSYYQTLNDIDSYQGGGMSEFLPTFFGMPNSIGFFVKIPTELFESGQINSMEKVETAFAKIGINGWVKSTDSANSGYIITTTSKYLDELTNLDTLGIERR
ncbi:MAG: hypothetical protein O2887_09615 [Bacteroidetes bacterium]|nr:hypothetical protein [Bacteroidota bacterium]MDA1120728.1 hypothetical protein [Bacteroidota bacterium]